jgi:hypothetical protein
VKLLTAVETGQITESDLTGQLAVHGKSVGVPPSSVVSAAASVRRGNVKTSTARFKQKATDVQSVNYEPDSVKVKVTSSFLHVEMQQMKETEMRLWKELRRIVSNSLHPWVVTPPEVYMSRKFVFKHQQQNTMRTELKNSIMT